MRTTQEVTVSLLCTEQVPSISIGTWVIEIRWGQEQQMLGKGLEMSHYSGF